LDGDFSADFVVGGRFEIRQPPIDFGSPLPGSPIGSPVVSVGSPPRTSEVFKYQTLSVSYDTATNRTIIGAREISHDFLGSPVRLTGSPTLGSPFAEGSPPLSGNEFFFPPYPAGSISNGDVFICYPVVQTSTLNIIARPSPFYGSPGFYAAGAFVQANRTGSPKPQLGSPFTPVWHDFSGSPLPGSPKTVTGSPLIYPNFGSPEVHGNTIVIKSTTPDVFSYGQEIEIRDATDATINRQHNIYSVKDLGGSPNLLEITVLDSVLTDVVGSPFGKQVAELVFTPNGWSGGDICSDVPPELVQVHWLEDLQLSWRFAGDPSVGGDEITFIDNFIGSPQIDSEESPGFHGTGTSLTSTGNRAVIGYRGRNGFSLGRVRILDRTGNRYSKTLQLDQPDGSQTDRFGESLDINDDGTIIVIGAPGRQAVDDGGAFYIYEIAGSPITFTKFSTPDAANLDVFGDYVAISNDGTTVAVGAEISTVPSTGIADVYIYQKVGGTWTNVATIATPDETEDPTADRAGASVEVSDDGTRIAVGRFGVDNRKGRVYAYTRTGSPQQWLLEAQFDPTSTPVGSPVGTTDLGTNVSMSANGNTIAGAAPNDSGGIGAIYIYTRQTGSPVTWITEKKIRAPSTAGFGSSVTISDNGAFIVIGARFEAVPGPGADGAAYIYKHTVGSPTWEQTIRISGRAGSPSTGAGGLFGSSVDFSGDGSSLIVGVQRYVDPLTALEPGAAWIYDSNIVASTLLTDAFQHFILTADATANTITVQGDVRNILTDFGINSPLVVNATIQHAVTVFGSPWSFGSPLADLSANNGNVVISAITYDVDSNISTLSLDTVSVSLGSGWIISR
jgi:hypothetical protein